jgi:hypothetical protein
MIDDRLKSRRFAIAYLDEALMAVHYVPPQFIGLRPQNIEWRELAAHFGTFVDVVKVPIQ